MIRVQLALVILLLVSCKDRSQNKHRVVLECGIDTLINLKPPEHTFKCCLELMDSCSSVDSIQVYLDSKPVIGAHFKTDQKGFKHCQDWYSGEFGIGLHSSASTTEAKDKLILELEFFN